ncbi:MAG TPA: hypothetical protein H9870_00840 [Candidatus Corynebacterium avicola]|uniref:Uncharacterized protein n=1 Tax=Candidatus Corynebacterium avicola TaxID=2838527 RepID=A0A9D1RPB2_9CORY|nr:hypothetical protein [Candidatus Corynebacterium avicola]
MDINAFIEPFQQIGQHFGQHGDQLQQAPEQARQLIEQNDPAPKAPASSVLGSL